MIRDIDLDLPVEEEKEEVQVFVAENGKDYEDYDYGFFKLIEKYDGGTEKFVIEIRRSRNEELIIETEVTNECKFQR